MGVYTRRALELVNLTKRNTLGVGKMAWKKNRETDTRSRVKNLGGRELQGRGGNKEVSKKIKTCNRH